MAGEEAPGPHVGVLGPVEFGRASGPVPLAPALRTVLAALAVDVGRVVDADVLADRIWGGTGLRPASSTMHSAVSRLRRAIELPDGPGPLVRTRAPGYQLLLNPEALDVTRFDALLTRARGLAAVDPVAARGGVEQALALWRGDAYADVSADFARDEARRLQTRRLQALELRARLDLDLGRHREVVADLVDLVAANPLHEDLRGALALALYRSARQAEALGVLDAGRRLLADELGIDPGPGLRRLRDQVLRQDPALEPPAVAVTVGPPSPTVNRPSREAGLPEAVTTLIGRDEEVTAIVDLLSRSRLVTLTGTGGVGKTRVAAAVARVVRSRTGGEGVWFVPLAPLTHAAAVLPAVARALGLPTATEDEALEAVVSGVGPRGGLLVLDNCEHLLEVAGDVAELVARCPGLSVLVTSRAPLRLGGEVEHRVEPLDQASAVRLFVERAAAVAPGFVLDAPSQGPVAQICAALSGIPLALELAAARVRVLHVRDLLARLDQALAGGARDLPPRQRTMRATLDWSYGLLDPTSQGLFRRLGVFTGGWSLEVLEQMEGPDVLGALEVLVEHSLVTVDFAGTPSQGPDVSVARYSMLEPTVQHARRLLVGDERQIACAAHARAHAALAERATVAYRGAVQVFWLDRMELEHPNVLAAIDWATGSGERDLAGRLVWASWLFWWLRGHIRTGHRCAEAVVAAAGRTGSSAGGTSLAGVRARTAAAAMAFAHGDGARAEQAWQQALEEAWALTGCTSDERAEALAQCEAGLGISALVAGDLDRAALGHRRAIALAEALPAHTWGPWIVRLNLIWGATVDARAGRVDEARRRLDLALRLAREAGDRLAIYMALYNQAQVVSDPAAAAASLLEGVTLSEQVGDRANLAYFLEALVVHLTRRARPDQAPVLLALAAAAETARESVGFEVYRYYPRDPALAAAATAGLRRMLDEHQLQQAEERGRTASVAEAVALATSAVTGASVGVGVLTAGPAAGPNRPS